MAVAVDARRALFERLIDHAPLFPPASMALADALAEDARVRASHDAWVVGRFVVPASRIEELGDAQPLLSVVVDGPVPDDARIAALEVPPGRNPEPVAGRGAEVYVEVPFDEAQPAALERLAGLGLRAKLRCGGTTTPRARELGAAIGRCLDLALPFKATAGLHHAVRRGDQHGFLNLLAAVLFDDPSALDEEDARAFTVTSDGFAWSGRRIEPEGIERVRREVFVGLGSCSFAEPVGELRALGLLPA